MVKRFLKYIPGPDADFVATRARREEGVADGLQIGECFVGDHQIIGLTRQNYRTALKFLEANGYIKIVETSKSNQKLTTDLTISLTIKPTTASTKVSLCDSRVWDINSEVANHQPNHQPNQAANHKEEENTRRRKKNTTSFGGAGGGGIFFDAAAQQFVGITDQLLKLWQSTYPQLDINHELAKMRLWLVDPSKPKRKGNQSFIQNWLSRAGSNQPTTKITPIQDAPELPEDPEIEALLARRDAACKMK